MINQLVMELFAIIQLIWSALFPFDLLGLLSQFGLLVVTYIPQLLTYLGYVFYFIPWVYLQPVILIVVAFIVGRVIMSLIRVVTDLL